MLYMYKQFDYSC